MKTLWYALCLAPFVCFAAGYYTISRLIGSEVIAAPALVGKRLQDIIGLIAPYNLNLRILSEVEEPALPEGTVIEQIPQEGQKIKIYHTMNVVVSKKPVLSTAPDLCDTDLGTARLLAEKNGLKLTIYKLYSNMPTDQCIAQYPQPGDVVNDRTVAVYVSAGTTPTRIMPSFVGLNTQQTSDFLAPYSLNFIIEPQEYQTHKACSSCIITAQKPIAGSIISLDKPPIIRFQVKHNPPET